MPLSHTLKFAGRVLRSPRTLFRRESLRRARLVGNASAPFDERLAYETLGRNDYAYGMFHAAVQAKALGIKRVTAVEFGVFNGDGLREMEMIAWCLKQELGVGFDLFGFDTGEGLPPPTVGVTLRTSGAPACLRHTATCRSSSNAPRWC